MEPWSKEKDYSSDASPWSEGETQWNRKVGVSVKAQPKLWLWEHDAFTTKPVNLCCPGLVMSDHSLRSCVD